MPRLPSSSSSGHAQASSNSERSSRSARSALAEAAQKKKEHEHPSGPFTRDCSAPTRGGAICFLCAFFGALMAVSIPTHVTGYFLDSTLSTVLIYVCVVSGFAYGALSTTAFFTIMEEAISERYGEGKEERRGKLDFVHIAMPVALLAILGSAIALFYFTAFSNTEDEWSSWCAANSVIFTEDFADDDETHNAAVLTQCVDWYLNQQYIIIGAPVILLLLEIVRFIQVRDFLKHLRTGREAVTPAAVQSLGKTHRRRSERRGRSRRRVEESSEDEKALLSV